MAKKKTNLENDSENGPTKAALEDSVDLDSLVNEHVDKAPEINEVIVEALTRPAVEGENDENDEPSSRDEPASKAQRDSGGNVFEPGYHSVNQDGSPKRTKTGKFRKRHKNARSEPSPETSAQNEQTFETTGAVIAGLFTFACQSYFGDHFAPSQIEKDTLAKSFADYCRVRELPDMPPEIAILSAVAIYVAPRWADERTKDGIRNIPVIGEKIVGRKIRKVENVAGGGA